MDRQRLERRLGQGDVDNLLDVPDEAADPEARLIAKDPRREHWLSCVRRPANITGITFEYSLSASR